METSTQIAHLICQQQIYVYPHWWDVFRTGTPQKGIVYEARPFSSHCSRVSLGILRTTIIGIRRSFYASDFALVHHACQLG